MENLVNDSTEEVDVNGKDSDVAVGVAMGVGGSGCKSTVAVVCSTISNTSESS